MSSSEEGGLGWLVPRTSRARFVWASVALGVFAMMTAVLFRALLGSNLEAMTVLPAGSPEARELRAWDQRYAVWAIIRNAQAFAHGSPLFAANQCFPAHDSLALGHGVFALGALALPVLPFSHDPVLVYDVVLLILAVTAPFALYVLVTDWTGLPAAGIVAGLVYGFHPAKVGDPDHVFLTDTAWLVLALWFLRRAVRRPERLGNAVGFGLCTVGQLAAGIYPAAASAFVGAILVTAFFVESRPTSRHVVPALVALVIVVAGAALLYRPYFALARSGVLVERGRVFLALSSLRPGGALFIGAVPALLAVGGAAARSSAASPAVPRALRLGLVLAAFVAVFLSIGGVFVPGPDAVQLGGPGGTTLPLHPSRAYELLSRVIPGLNIGRGPAYAYGAALVCLAILAGLGAAAAVEASARVTGRASRIAPFAVTALLLGVTCASVAAGLPRLEAFRIRPDDSEIALFEAAAELGSRGPVLELPLPEGLVAGKASSESLLLSAYHGRPTSRCYASFVESALPDDVRAAAQALPDGAAASRLVRAGFTTVFARRTEAPALVQYLQESVHPGGHIAHVVSNPGASVFALR